LTYTRTHPETSGRAASRVAVIIFVRKDMVSSDRDRARTCVIRVYLDLIAHGRIFDVLELLLLLHHHGLPSAHHRLNVWLVASVHVDLRCSIIYGLLVLRRDRLLLFFFLSLFGIISCHLGLRHLLDDVFEILK
jgi:hypothetical protein